MGLGQRIRTARTAASLTQGELADCAGITTAAISNLETRDLGRSTHVLEMAGCLGVDPNWLATGTGNMNIRKPNQVIEVPLISWVQAGEWAAAEDPYELGDAETWVPCPNGCSKLSYALTVSGESMEPDFRDGDIIIVDPKVDARHGDNVIVRVHNNNECTFKRLVVEGSRVYLKAVNPRWPTQIIEVQGDATVSGVVVSRISNFR